MRENLKQTLRRIELDREISEIEHGISSPEVSEHWIGIVGVQVGVLVGVRDKMVRKYVYWLEVRDLSSLPSNPDLL